MPFPWQTNGALNGGVPNQINAFTPQNAEGLGVPWGRAMFNLPRFQMPGSTVNFGGGFGLSGDMGSPLGQSQTGMQPGANIGNVRFSLTRQASSDPVQNVINDIQNPLGGMSLGFSGGGGTSTQGGGLRQQMTGNGLTQGPRMPFADPFSERALAEGYAGRTAAQQRDFGGASPISEHVAANWTDDPNSPFNFNPFSLRTRMLAQPPKPALVPATFM